jgi:ribokinase
MPARIAVVGSLNMDFVARVEKLPRPGETVLGAGFQTIPGGKGANQAYAAGRLGGRVRMIGRIGSDVFGQELRRSLQSAGVDISGILDTPDAATGVALIFVEAGGENVIVVAPGANAALDAADVEQALAGMDSGFLLLQLESPIETVIAAASIAHWCGVTVILDPAPARSLPRELLTCVDIITPNEGEALALLGRDGGSVPLPEAAAVARSLRELGVGTAILKLGAKGAMLSSPAAAAHFPAPGVEVVDATAAGDTFNGALAVALAEGRDVAEAIAFANVAAALSVTRAGAQASIPQRAEVDARMIRTADGRRRSTSI